MTICLAKLTGDAPIGVDPNINGGTALSSLLPSVATAGFCTPPEAAWRTSTVLSSPELLGADSAARELEERSWRSRSRCIGKSRLGSSVATDIVVGVGRQEESSWVPAPAKATGDRKEPSAEWHGSQGTVSLPDDSLLIVWEASKLSHVSFNA